MIENNNSSLLIRHADRDKIPEGSFGNDILLNEKGIINAKYFGSKLSGKRINKIFTSPIKRCVQTADYISMGYGAPIKIVETKALGAPGLHIYDEKLAGEYFLKYGFDYMYDKFIRQVEIPGVYNADKINERITTFINDNSAADGSTIFVTHDMLIVFYDFSLSNKVYTKDNWINYLEGLIL